jgi:hypothetical protein
MFDPSAIVMADQANRRHLLSAQPQAPVVRERAPRQRGAAVRHRAALRLRGLADRLEPPRVGTSVPAA